MLTFRGRATADVFHGRDSKAARKACPPELWPKARRLLEQIDSAGRLQDLAVPPGNRLERLKGDRQGQHSVRINDQYRICFVWSEQGAIGVEIVDYH